MQFELDGRPDAATLAAALRPLDPDAQVALDAGNGRLDVVTSASREQVATALRQAGYGVSPVVQELHVSGGSTCCGGCA